MNTKKQMKATPAKGKTNTTSAKTAIPAKATSKAAKPTAAKAKPAAKPAGKPTEKPADKAAAPKAAAAKPAPAKAEPPKAAAPKATEKAEPAKASAKPSPAKPADGAKPKLSLLKAAAAVLKASEEALNTKRMVELAKEKGLWTPGAGKTPEQTLYSAILREMKKHGDASTFVLVAKGHFKLRTAE